MTQYSQVQNNVGPTIFLKPIFFCVIVNENEIIDNIDRHLLND